MVGDSIMGAVVSVAGAVVGLSTGVALDGAADPSQTVAMAGAGGALGYGVHLLGKAVVGWVDADARMRRALADLCETLSRRFPDAD